MTWSSSPYSGVSISPLPSQLALKRTRGDAKCSSLQGSSCRRFGWSARSRRQRRVRRMGGNNQRHPKVRTMNQVTVIEWDSKEQGLQLCGPNKGEESMIQQPELIAASFEDQYTAKLFLDQLKLMEKAGTIELIDAAVLTKQTDGKLKINELGKLRPRQGRRL